MNGGCHCGAVTIHVPGRPSYLNACNCTLCTSLGVLWGYYPASRVTIAGETSGYVRADVARPESRFAFCGRCSATTHWSLLDPKGEDRVGVNMRLFDPATLKGVEVRYIDERNYEAAECRTYREPSVFDGAGVKI